VISERMPMFRLFLDVLKLVAGGYVPEMKADSSEMAIEKLTPPNGVTGGA
jgi:hypothetical protein